MNNLQKLKFGAIQQRAPQMTMDLPVPPNTRMSLIARAAATSLDELRRLNLDIKGTSTPERAELRGSGGEGQRVASARHAAGAAPEPKTTATCALPQNFDWGRQRFTPEMQEACRRNLGARAAASAAPLQLRSPREPAPETRSGRFREESDRPAQTSWSLR